VTQPQSYELFRRVQQAAEGTPYLVEQTDEGFDVTIDIVDAQWYGILSKAGLSKKFTHHVSVDDAKYTIADDSVEVQWVKGVPRTAGSVERKYGRQIEVSFEKSWAFNEEGEFGKVVDYSFSSEEGRSLVTQAADDLGLKYKRGAAEMAGLICALVAVTGLLLGGVLALILYLMGYLN
jgi:hypothetical protein